MLMKRLYEWRRKARRSASPAAARAIKRILAFRESRVVQTIDGILAESLVPNRGAASTAGARQATRDRVRASRRRHRVAVSRPTAGMEGTARTSASGDPHAAGNSHRHRPPQRATGRRTSLAEKTAQGEARGGFVNRRSKKFSTPVGPCFAPVAPAPCAPQGPTGVVGVGARRPLTTDKGDISIGRKRGDISNGCQHSRPNSCISRTRLLDSFSHRQAICLPCDHG